MQTRGRSRRERPARRDAGSGGTPAQRQDRRTSGRPGPLRPCPRTGPAARYHGPFHLRRRTGIAAQKRLRRPPAYPDSAPRRRRGSPLPAAGRRACRCRIRCPPLYSAPAARTALPASPGIPGHKKVWRPDSPGAGPIEAVKGVAHLDPLPANSPLIVPWELAACKMQGAAEKPWFSTSKTGQGVVYYHRILNNQREKGKIVCRPSVLTIRSTSPPSPSRSKSASPSSAASCIWSSAASCSTTTTPPGCCGIRAGQQDPDAPAAAGRRGDPHCH